MRSVERSSGRGSGFHLCVPPTVGGLETAASTGRAAPAGSGEGLEEAGAGFAGFPGVAGYAGLGVTFVLPTGTAAFWPASVLPAACLPFDFATLLKRAVRPLERVWEVAGLPGGASVVFCSRAWRTSARLCLPEKIMLVRNKRRQMADLSVPRFMFSPLVADRYWRMLCDTGISLRGKL